MRPILVGILLTAGILGTRISGAEAQVPSALLPSVGACLDFSSPSPCEDTDGDGAWNQLEWDAESDWQNPASTPEFGLLDEEFGSNTCRDGNDNDLDGRRDQQDVGCRVTCKDFGPNDRCRDKDRDGFVGYREEWYGSDPNDPSSTPEIFSIPDTCEDGIDNDLDGHVDLNDVGCGGSCIDFSGTVDCGPP